LDVFRKLHVELQTYKEALHAARDNLETYCNEFAKDFTHPKTQGKKEMCIAQIIQIVMGVIGALIAIINIRQALYALMPTIMGGISGLVSVSAVGVSEIAAEVAVEAGVEAWLDGVASSSTASFTQ
jgi:hypothetical protein